MIQPHWLRYAVNYRFIKNPICVLIKNQPLIHLIVLILVPFFREFFIISARAFLLDTTSIFLTA